MTEELNSMDLPDSHTSTSQRSNVQTFNDIASAPTIAPVSRETVEMLSDLYDEPDWMRAARLEAWDLYTGLDLPDQQEEAWRRTNLRAYPLDTLRLTFSARELDGIYSLPPCWDVMLAPVEQVSGVLVHCNGARTYSTLRREDARHGVLLESLHTALLTHGDLIRSYWMQGVTTRPETNKFTALNAALWHGGTFVYVPAGVHVARPLQSLVAYDAEGGTGLHHTLLVAERGSRVTLIQDRVSQDLQDEVNAEIVEIYAEAGAWVRYVSLQHWSEHRHSVSVQEAQVAQDTNFVWVAGSLGGRMTKDFLRSNLRETGARVAMAGFSFVHGDQHLDQSTYQHHQASHTYSDLLFRNVLRDQARTVFYGMIRVETDAGGGTEGYQASNNLLLDDARVHAIPGLEIIANDVRCSHGATVSRIDPEERFYLQARGLSQPDAEGLIVQGFVRPIVERTPLAYLRNRLEGEIVERFWS
ncbi:MAG: Fe-S cluster assembly protein SufD [Anaerolineae bacterium]